MDKHLTTNILGTVGTFTLEGVHLVLASVCAILTAVHAGYSIYLKYKGKNKK